MVPSLALGKKNVVSPASNSSFKYIRKVKSDDCFASGGEASYIYASVAGSIDEGGQAPSRFMSTQYRN